MAYSSSDEERPSIIEEVIFYNKPGVPAESGKDLFEKRLRSRTIAKAKIKIEPEEVNDIEIKTELIIEDDLNESKGIIELLSPDISSNTHNFKSTASKRKANDKETLQSKTNRLDKRKQKLETYSEEYASKNGIEKECSDENQIDSQDESVLQENASKSAKPVPVNIISVQTIQSTQNPAVPNYVMTVQNVHLQNKHIKTLNKHTKIITRNLTERGQEMNIKHTIFERPNSPEPQQIVINENAKRETEKNVEIVTSQGNRSSVAASVVANDQVEETEGQSNANASIFYRCEQCKEDFLTQEELICHANDTKHTTPKDNVVLVSEAGLEIEKVSGTENRFEEDIFDDDERDEWMPEDYAEYKLKHSAAKKRPIRVHKCKICLDIFKSYYLLCKHKVIHYTKINPYECRQCDSTFDELETFTAHIRMHQGKNPYPCQKCEMGFMTKHELEDHSKVHILRKNPPKVKRFRCDICGKEFAKLCDMERHTRVHTGEKPAECNICHKRFQQTHNLSKHLLTHLQVKPFQCDICNKKFGRVDVLNRHLLTHSLEKPFKCLLCPKGFIRMFQYQGHMKKNHPGVDCAENESSDTNNATTEKNTQNQGPFQASEEDPDNDLEIQEDRVNIISVDEMEPDVPEEVVIVHRKKSRNRKNENKTEVIKIIETNEFTANRKVKEENILPEESEEVLQEVEEPDLLLEDSEVIKEPGAMQCETYSRKNIVVHQVHAIASATTDDPNVIMERILNPPEDVREQIIDEIN